MLGVTGGMLAAVALAGGCDSKPAPKPAPGGVVTTKVVRADGVPLGAWSVRMTATGGELGAASHVIEIAGIGSAGKAARTQAGKEAARVIDDAAAKTLWGEIDSTGAWSLTDVNVPAKDASDYVIEINTTEKSHTIKATGVHASSQHLRLILAIQRCAGYEGGIP